MKSNPMQQTSSYSKSQNQSAHTSPFPGGTKKAISSLKSYIEKKISSISRRIKIVEEHMDSISSRVQMTEKDVIEKHKSSIKRINKLEKELREVRSKMHDMEEMNSRITDRLREFASKEEVEVMERYSRWWQPLEYVTREEVKKLINDALDNKEKGD